MEIARRIFSSIWKVWFVISFLLPFILFLPFYLVFLPNKSLLKPAFFFARLHSFLIVFLSGIRIRKKYLFKKSDLPQPCVYVANHTSYLDIIASYLVIPNYFVFMAKAELNKVPVFNLFFKHMNILVNRKSRVDAHRAFLRCAEEIEKGNSVYIFPEGTISSEAKLNQFKNGAFKLAIDKQVPIVPIAYSQNWKLLQNGGFFKSLGRPGITEATIYAPISTKGLTDENLITLRDKVFQIFLKEAEENKKKK